MHEAQPHSFGKLILQCRRIYKDMLSATKQMRTKVWGDYIWRRWQLCWHVSATMFLLIVLEFKWGCCTVEDARYCNLESHVTEFFLWSHWIVICGESLLDSTFQGWHGDRDHWLCYQWEFQWVLDIKTMHLFGFFRDILVCLCKIETCSRLRGLQFGCGTTWTWLNQILLNPGWAWVDQEPDPKFSSILVMSIYGGEKGLYRILGYF